MKSKLQTALLAAITAATASAASADCTAAEMQQKVNALTAAMQQLATTDPARMQSVSSRMQEATASLAGGGDISDACALYDQLLAELG